MSVRVIHADSRDALLTLADASVDSCVCDPPYALVSIGKRFGAENAAPAMAGATGAYVRASKGFMGKTWDTGEVAFDPAFWREVLRVIKPGGHIVAFGGTRSHHRLWCAIEDAGFEVRDTLAWLYGSGFPKSHDVAKAIDKAETGVTRGQRGQRGQSFGQEYERKPKGEPITENAKAWEGWGTALKPALEPICLARKPLAGTVAANALKHGTGALNIDATRNGDELRHNPSCATNGQSAPVLTVGRETVGRETVGRWPANVMHDGSAEATAHFPEMTARYFYSPKADDDDRCGSKHPTIKPTDLMAWLIKLVTPKGGLVLDPFAGSGSTGMAAMREGFDAILIEREAEYYADIQRRIAHVQGLDSPLFGGPLVEPPPQGSCHLRRLRGRAIGPTGLRT